MREIIFRGKRFDNGEWIEGNLFIPDRDDTPTEICIGTNIVRISYDVQPETIGQYTGLTDKNGKKIFEGDIVKMYLTNGAEIGYIKYENKSCRFLFIDEYSFGYGFDDTCLPEVIGNIHDNPKLLGGDV